MLSYRHAFHAGNAADVLKHSVLVYCLEYLLKKEKPLLCVDTHAGAGLYSLHEGYAAQNREWERGLGKITGNMLPPMLGRYLSLCAGEGNPQAVPSVYPGSPLIMARLLRPVDRLFCFELHPADYAFCRTVLPSGAELRQADGFTGLKGLLPPPSRRGLILIDPSYEIKEDFVRLPETLAQAIKRFSTGTYIVWYPLLREAPELAGDFSAQILDMYRGNRCCAELYTADRSAVPTNSPRGMYGSGLVIFNPPWTLHAALSESLPIMGKLLGTGERGWSLSFFEKPLNGGT